MQRICFLWAQVAVGCKSRATTTTRRPRRARHSALWKCGVPTQARFLERGLLFFQTGCPATFSGFRFRVTFHIGTFRCGRTTRRRDYASTRCVSLGRLAQVPVRPPRCHLRFRIHLRRRIHLTRSLCSTTCRSRSTICTSRRCLKRRRPPLGCCSRPVAVCKKKRRRRSSMRFPRRI